MNPTKPLNRDDFLLVPRWALAILILNLFFVLGVLAFGVSAVGRRDRDIELLLNKIENISNSAKIDVEQHRESALQQHCAGALISTKELVLLESIAKAVDADAPQDVGSRSVRQFIDAACTHALDGGFLKKMSR